MALVLGVIAGLAYGLSAFAGAFVALPLLMLGLNLTPHTGLPVALSGLALCAAIAAGDAARARQCDTRLALALMTGGVPTAIAAAWLAQALEAIALVSIFTPAAIVGGFLLLRSTGRAQHVSPSALLTAPRRPLAEAAEAPPHTNRQLLRIACSALPSGLLLALTAAPAAGWLASRLDRAIPDQPFLNIGTVALVVAAMAVAAATTQFALAPAVPGYTAGLYVLGTVAGMGFARRVQKPFARLWAARVLGVAAVFAGMLWIVVAYSIFK